MEVRSAEGARPRGEEKINDRRDNIRSRFASSHEFRRRSICRIRSIDREDIPEGEPVEQEDELPLLTLFGRPGSR